MDKICKQIRFYFSITNLACDNFLLTKLKYEKGISIEVLLKFKKLAKLLKKFENPVETVALACEEVPELVGTNGKISLLHPISDMDIEEYRKNAVVRTIYFENIPDSASHHSMKRLFSRCGKVLYVSLPRFAESEIVKGFGFVEFADVKSAENAVAELNGKNLENTEGFDRNLKVMMKSQWNAYKERFQDLKKRLRAEEGDLEFNLKVANISEDVTTTQISECLQIKPWKIEYKPGSGEALLKFASEFDRKAVLKCQPYIRGKQVFYIDIHI